MAEIIDLPDNIIGKQDHEHLESFGAHEMALGRANRYQWAKQADGDPVFQLFRGYPDQKLIVKITRNRKKDVFTAEDAQGLKIAEGKLEQVMSVLDNYLTKKNEYDSPA